MPDEGRGRARGAPIPHSLDICDDDDDDLSIVEMTPRIVASVDSLWNDEDFLHCQNSIIEAASTGTGLRREGSIVTGAPNAQSNEGQDEPVSAKSVVGSFVSSFARGWAAYGGVKQAEKLNVASPCSVVQRASEVKAHPDASSREGRDEPTTAHVLSAAQRERECMSRPLFTAIDGPEAREFQDFLDDEGGSSAGIPVLCLVEYGVQGSYASDIWVIMHNTLRRELFDAYEIVNVLRKRHLSLKLADVYELRKWWRFFVILWHEFDVHTKNSLTPLVEQICLVDGRKEVLKRRLAPLRETREWLTLKLEETTSYIEEFEKLSPARALILICKAIDSFAARTLSFFAGQERLLPGLIESYHGESIKLSIECKLLEQLRASQYYPELLTSVVRWIGTSHGEPQTKHSKIRSKWLYSHLYWMERHSLSRSFQRYELSHGEVVANFQSKLKSSDSL